MRGIYRGLTLISGKLIIIESSCQRENDIINLSGDFY